MASDGGTKGNTLNKLTVKVPDALLLKLKVKMERQCVLWRGLLIRQNGKTQHSNLWRVHDLLFVPLKVVPGVR